MCIQRAPWPSSSRKYTLNATFIASEIIDVPKIKVCIIYLRLLENYKHAEKDASVTAKKDTQMEVM